MAKIIKRKEVQSKVVEQLVVKMLQKLAAIKAISLRP